MNLASEISSGSQPCDLKRSAVEEVTWELAKKVGCVPGGSLEKVVSLLGGEILDIIKRSVGKTGHG